MKRAQILPTVVMMGALLLSCVAATHAQAQSDDCRYFEETGHYVCGDFLEFYDTRGALENFGYPLAESFDDPARGLRVQYFQRARMEWHPYNPAPYTVQLGLLVDDLGYDFPAAQRTQIPAFNSSIRHYFPETRHVVSYAFLDYFREKGGLDIFGYPRSESLYQDGYLVQYFQRARMEWHPEDPSGPRMRLTNLGETYIERFGIPGDYDEPLPPPARPGGAPEKIEPPVTTLNIRASVGQVIIEQGGRQTVFVYATDQRREPVEGADISMVIHYQGDQRYDFEPTGARGFTSQSFDIPQTTASRGRRVVVDVTATYGSLKASTQTFFMPWW